MKILVLGANGMLGHKLIQELEKSNDVLGTVRCDESVLLDAGVFENAPIIGGVDILETDAIGLLVKEQRPDVVINATGVIKHREDSKNEVLSIRVNSLFPHLLKEITQENGARLVCFSTDCVFNGAKGMYTEADPTDALDIYGKTKALGEVAGENCLTIRSSIIGRELGESHSLVEWFLSNRDGKVKGFVNALYTGFTTLEMSRIVEWIITEEPDLNGIYHVSGDVISKYDLLHLLNKEFETEIEVLEDREFAIDRSLDSGKFRAKTGFQPKSWPKMIEELAKDSARYETWRNQIT